jgi:DNA invertase Pin-like site-specific DNA recombinase
MVTARVSTRDQNDESQHDLLADAACARIFTDKASGKLARRPEWDRCLDHLRAGDTLVVTRLSRIARSVRNLTDVVAQLDDRGINLLVLRQQIDTRTPTGKLVFHMLAAIDEFQADLISENTEEGLAVARARGRKGGRRPKLSVEHVAHARTMVDEGKPITEVAAFFRVTRPTIYRALSEEVSA